MTVSTVLTSCGYAPVTGNTVTADGEESNGSISSDDSNINTNTNIQQLQIFDTGLTLTQDQVASKIKAQYLLDNNGYKDEDIIVAIVSLSEPSLVDIYLENSNINNKMTIAEYAASVEGKAKLEEIKASQKKLIDELFDKGLIEKVEDSYSTIINAVAVSTEYKNFSLLGKVATISNTILSETYNKPQSQTGTDASAIINAVDIYKTGIFDSSCVDFTGKGTSVAILDSGFDCDHTVFSTMPNTNNLMITQKDVSAMLVESTALKLGGDVELMDVYINKKIPFVFDYADKDTDVYPYDSEHGTHVAGIIGGHDNTITGVAVDTQLVLMKVFPDLDEGGNTEDILAALEDAVLLGVDAINMSLGSSCGFAREADGNAINDIYDKINESGISLITAASNDYSSAFGGEQGNTNKVTNPDSATVGSPSTYASALSVASISGTKSKFLMGNDSQIVFFSESNSVSGKPNDFFAEIGLKEGESKTYEYVTIPGVGMRANYNGLDVNGKIALVRRGDTTFEDKALQAKNAGAIACIIYNNIEGDILMSMGKTDHIPTISISKQNGTELAKKATGTITISYKQQAGPFMSDFSSWGPNPNLELKPEITAHGGNILSAIPGGGYDELSGTSMATPNLCGIVILIRQYLKEKFPDYTMKQISVICNQMLMSTATIILNEEGNPYSPRKQGAGLASLSNVVNTSAYLTVEGIDRTKLELGDDAKRTGVYSMTFSIVNTSDKDLSYKLGIIGMTETVSSSDDSFVAEKDQILGGTFTSVVEGDGSINDKVVTVKAGKTASVTVTYVLTESDKKMIDKLFPYGMYVEGFVTLDAVDDDEVNLNIPFLAFYGDWTEAPMFDKTYYEVDAEKKDASIDEEDKLKADYYATTPYGSYYYNYIIPLGTYLYDIDTSIYDDIPASLEHIAVSDYLGTIDGISAVYAGLLRNAKTMTYTITDKVTGEVVKELTVDNSRKAHSSGGTPIPNYEYLRWKSGELGLINNRQYEFKMEARLDYGDGGATTNIRNVFEFDFYLDNEAPVLKSCSYEKVYDKTLKKDRYYITMTVYDNHYIQSITPISFTSTSSYTFLTENPIPVYGEMGKDNVIKFEITDYLDELYNDEILTSALAFSIDDYALNSNIYLCQLPGTKGDFKFTKDGTPDGTDLSILSIYEDDIVDLTKFLSTGDESVDENKDYLKYLTWTTSNDKVVTIEEGKLRGIAEGRATVTVTQELDEKQAVIIINVKKHAENAASETQKPLISSEHAVDIKNETIQSIRFDYFDTLFAYSRAAQTSQIGQTGDRKYINSLENGTITLYPGEKIQLFYDLEPWYVADKYEVTFSSDNEDSVIIDEKGVMTALAKGTANISLKVSGSNIMTYVKVSVNSEFVIENRTLIAYKGLGGEVVIPDDEGILYIGAYAFCLYDTDNSFELTEDDYDANKIPAANTSITSIVIPEGVEEIQKYAFYNCSGLRTVTLPSSVRIIREFAFNKDAKLETINLENVEVIGAYAFSGCEKLIDIDLSKTYAIGIRGFHDCKSINNLDLSALRNTAAEAFMGCTGLENVKLTEKTKLSRGMFAKSGLKKVDIYTTTEIPKYCFSQCDDLTTVTFHNNLAIIGFASFCQCDSLVNVTLPAKVEVIEEQAFYDCNALESIKLPDCTFVLGNYTFFDCDNFKTVEFGNNTQISENQGSVFYKTALKTFVVSSGNNYYKVSGNYLLNKAGDTIVFAAVAPDYASLTIPNGIKTIGQGAFSGVNITELTIPSSVKLISDYAFANCETLEKLILVSASSLEIGKHAFNYCKGLIEIEGLDKVKSVGDYAFANSGVQDLTLGSDSTYGEGAFFQSKLVSITIGRNSSFGLGAFQNCSYLEKVFMPAEGGVHFGEACFANDSELHVIDLSKVDNTIENQTFYGCSRLQNANLAQVEYIGDYAFADCSALNYITIPKVISIGEGAFARYDKFAGAPTVNYIDFPNTLTTMKDGAFAGCEGLMEVVLPDSLTDYGNYLFSYCINLETVTIPDNMKRIGEYTFAGCIVLKSINLQNVEEIGDFAFANSSELENLNRGTSGDNTILDNLKTIGIGAFAGTALEGKLIANNLTEVGDFAFQNTNLEAFDMKKLTDIGVAAFQGNTNLKEFVFSKELSKLGNMAFEGCTSLENFYVLSDGEKKNSYGDVGDYLVVADGIAYITLESGKLQLMSVPSGKNIETLRVLDGTVRIDGRAGNENVNIKNIILPDSLKLIGNYAFYGYTGLETVEFRSFSAPLWENYYDSDSALTEDDPGYGLLHDQYDVFELELCYYNFIDLLGKYESISMILPSNPDAEGYDSLNYLVSFGPVSEAERSDYIAMDKTLINFIEYATKISGINAVTLSHETLINNAVTAYNALKQKGTDFGYSEEEWNNMIDTVIAAKAKLVALKLANASNAARTIQELINKLPDTYSSEYKSAMAEIEKMLAELPVSERTVLTLTKYNNLLSAYKADVSSSNNEEESTEATETENAEVENNKVPVTFVIILSICGAVILLLCIVAIIISVVSKKNKKGGKEE